MREYIAIGLMMFILCITVLSVYRLALERSPSVDDNDIPPISNALMVWIALVVAAVVLLSFVVLYGRKLNIENNIGQIGDFVGGLINPVLSFLALLVLLRTTLIQTIEARKTTKFMASQQRILEVEKFENTFFQLLDRVEQYCDLHLRVKSEIKAGGVEKISVTVNNLKSKRKEFDLLNWREQMKAVKSHISSEAKGDITNGFFLRTRRVVQMVHDAGISEDLKVVYMEVVRDTLTPHERILFSSQCFVRGGKFRKLVKKYNFSYLKHHAFPSKIIADYFEGS
ncbi:hypothetical protein [Pseudomonas sp. Q1]|uniref:hypothetical protein n=1 Tax=Pseudomonas sp. Q1 TaxID=2202823 RepID=UPI001374F3A4|nr:hypothetical protein [Pseudomonas sp. Q1]NCE87020.1 hypothetical protein [Pseudomonas sp. Q1]